MNPERWERIREIFDEVVDLDPEDRERALDELCGDDSSLRKEVQSLLSAHEDADEVLGRFEDESFAPRVSESSSRAGTRVGPYEIEKELGRGGMGVVYRARDTRLDRTVVLKFLSPELSTDEKAKERFVREARAASSLDHPHICTIHEIGETDEGQVYIVMAHYEGRTLEEQRADGPADAERAAEWALQIVDGLAAAHQAGIVHRDVKPGNVMLTEEEMIKILDFGVAKTAGQDLTKTGSTLGTVTYMSPEQARGQPVDERTDYWSLGVVLYELLAGRPPFQASYEQATLYAIIHQDPDRLDRVRSDLPPELVQLVHDLLEKDPDRRLTDADEITARLRSVARGKSKSAESEAGGNRLAGSPSSNLRRHLRALGLTAAIAAIFGLIWVFDLTPLPGGSSTGEPSSERSNLQSVAVLPFTVQGSDDLAYLREGIVDLLSTKLDGAGRLKSIDPNALLGYLARNPDRVLDPEYGREVAEHFGAGQFVLGRIIEVGNRVQFSATLYDSGGEVMTTARVTTSDENQLLGAVDDLTQQLIAGRLTGPSDRLSSLGLFTTTSLPALKAYLRAEQHIRDGAFEEASSLLEDAVARDSTFGLAWYRLATTLGWLDPSRSAEVIDRAVAHSDSLPERTRDLILGFQDFINGEARAAERRFREILSRHPDEVAAWQQLGEVLYHYNALYGRPVEEARKPFERALTYDSDNREIIIHLMDLAIRAGNYQRLDSLVATYAGSEDQTAWRENAYRTASRLLQSPASVRSHLVDHLDLGRREKWWLIQQLTKAGHITLGAQVGRQFLHTVPDRTFEGQLRGLLSLLEVSRGRWAAADSLLRTREGGSESPFPGGATLLSILYRSLPHAPANPERLRRLRERVTTWDERDLPSLPGETDPFADDRSAIRAFLLGLSDLRLEGQSGVQDDLAVLEEEAQSRGPRTLSEILHRSLQARVAWRRGDSERALAVLDSLQRGGYPPFRRSRGILFDPFYNRFLRAEILQSRGRREEALRWYDSVVEGLGVSGNLMLGPTYRRRAEIYEQLGRDDEAITEWRRLVELWDQSDPHLRAQIDTARKHLARLTGRPELLAADSTADFLPEDAPGTDERSAPFGLDSTSIGALLELARTSMTTESGDSLLQALRRAGRRVERLGSTELEAVVAKALQEAEADLESDLREERESDRRGPSR